MLKSEILTMPMPRAFFLISIAFEAFLTQILIHQIFALDYSWWDHASVFANLASFDNFGVMVAQLHMGHDFAAILGFLKSKMRHGPD